MRNEQALLIECLERLNRVAIPYMLTGSMASNYWGIPRSTHDLDFVIQLETQTVSHLVAAFESGFFIQSESVANALNPPHQFNAIDEDSALKVDYWVKQDVPFENSMFRRRVQVSLFKTPAWVATAEDIVLHKLYRNRLTPSERQLFDAAGIVAVQAKRLDQVYLDQWGKLLGVEHEIADLRSGKIQPKGT